MKQLKVTIMTLVCLLSLSAIKAQVEIEEPVKIVITEYYTDKLDADFYTAYNDYINGKNQAAADRIIAAAEYIHVQAVEAQEKDKKALNNSYQELLNLSKALEANKINSTKQLSHIFSKAHYALSRHHYAQAILLQSKKDLKKTGEAMHMATKSLEHAARWSGDVVGEGANNAWKETKKVGEAIGKGTKFTEEEIVKGIKSIGRESKKLGKKIFSHKKETYDIYWLEEVDY